ncbi:exopolysaccharide production repressor protein [Sinorhizobium alkalisoli]|uniref:exopolysaccharide production repressor protein n=1 Tax=Sinorhizobium alkalisoli TaxID=1752398 RepID=UPI001FD9F05C|nr:exopolysaccharide production repressor protein [Sinorhizobium alkalisoli]
MVLCADLLAVYFVSHSIRKVIITALGISVLLQVAYFGSVLFFVWRAKSTRRAVERAGQERSYSDHS